MKLEVTIFAARDLPRLNTRTRQFPYCVLQMSGMDGEVLTQAVKSSRAPEWNETFHLSGISSEELDVTLTVMHKDTPISTVTFNLSGVGPGEKIDQWVGLQAVDSGESGGEIHVGFSFLEEENEEEAIDEPDVDVEDDNPDSSIPSTPKSSMAATPKSKRTDADEDSIEMEERQRRIAEIEQKAAEQAQQKYAAFLNHTTPTLIDNEKRMVKYRADMEEGSEDDE